MPVINLPHLSPNRRRLPGQSRSALPGINRPESRLNQEFLRLYKEAKSSGASILTQSNWPLALARQAAQNVGQTARADTINNAMADSTAIAKSNSPLFEIYGTVSRVLADGVLVNGKVFIPDHDTGFEGRFLLRNHPRQKTFAEDDTFQGTLAKRIDNYTDGHSILRAYEYVRSGSNDYPEP